MCNVLNMSYLFAKAISEGNFLALPQALLLFKSVFFTPAPVHSVSCLFSMLHLCTLIKFMCQCLSKNVESSIFRQTPFATNQLYTHHKIWKPATSFRQLVLNFYQLSRQRVFLNQRHIQVMIQGLDLHFQGAIFPLVPVRIHFHFNINVSHDACYCVRGKTWVDSLHQLAILCRTKH